jgi:hypothetical protein
MLLPVEQPIRFCSNPEHFGDGTQMYKLRTNRPRWWVVSAPRWLPAPKLEEIFEAGANRWAKVANVYATRATSREDADWIIFAQDIDGKGRVLANAQLPSPILRQQEVNLDIAEFDLIDRLPDILGHEVGHLYGLQHFPSSPPAEWMEPTLGLVNTPQAAEAALMGQLYGLPLPGGPAPGIPSAEPLVCSMRIQPGSGVVECSISVQQGARKAELKGTKAW